MAHQANQDYQPTAPERSLFAQLKLGAGAIAAVLLLIFMAQNLQRVEIHFLWYDWHTRLLFALLIAAAFGGISAIVAGTLVRRGERQEPQARRR
jgi:uncharacterized integral membrane protein